MPPTTQGSFRNGPSQADDPSGEYLADNFAHCVRFATDIEHQWPRVIELNLSCPHTYGIEGSVFQKPELARKVCSKAREMISGCGKPVRLLAKIGYLQEEALRRLRDATAEFVDGFSAINTRPTEIWRTADDGREVPYFAEDEMTAKFKTAGVSGILIQKCALQTIEQLRVILDRDGLSNKVIFGMGGVSTPQDVRRFQDAGASIVQATTAFFHNARIAAEVRQFLAKNNPHDSLSPDTLDRLGVAVLRLAGCDGPSFVRFLTEHLSKIYRQFVSSKAGPKKNRRKAAGARKSSSEPRLFR